MAEQLPDGSVSLPGFRATRFLFTRPFILWPAIVAGLAWSVFVFVTPMKSGPATIGQLLSMLALAPLLGFGVAVLTGLPGFFVYRLARTPRPSEELAAGEALLYRTRANDILGPEARGGHLLVTSQRLLFIPHRLNVQLDRWDISLEDVERVAAGRITAPSGATLTTVIRLGAADSSMIVLVPRAEALADLIDALRERPEASRAGAAPGLLVSLGLPGGTK